MHDDIPEKQKKHVVKPGTLSNLASDDSHNKILGKILSGAKESDSVVFCLHEMTVSMR